MSRTEIQGMLDDIKMIKDMETAQSLTEQLYEVAWDLTRDDYQRIMLQYTMKIAQITNLSKNGKQLL